MRINKTTKHSSVGVVGCAGVLGLLAVAMLCPFHSSNANADDGTASNGTTTFALTAKPVIAVSLDPSVNVSVVPKSNGSFGASSAKLTVTTNNTTGFKVLMNAVGTTDLTSTDTTNTSKISTIGASGTPSSFGNNQWGYYIGQVPVAGNSAQYDGLTFNPVSTTSNQILLTDTAGEVTNYDLAFGTMISTSLPAGTYTGNVVVSAVTNPMTITSLEQLTYMQEMTPNICESTKLDANNPVTKQLIDTRDGNSYWVAKLKDGRCWMTQNLDFDVTQQRIANGSINSSNTNLVSSAANDQYGPGFVGNAWTATPNGLTGDALANAGWTAREITNGTRTYTVYDKKDGDTVTETYYPPVVTETKVPEAISSPSQVTTYSWDFGKWVLATPLAGKSCGDVTDISACTDFGFVDVSGAEWKPTYTAQMGSFNGEQVFTAVDQTNKTYDPHYLIGNYYQYNTATAGTGGTIVSKDASSSICPKGWQLPTSGPDNQGQGSFYGLLSQYGLTSSVTGSADGINYNIAQAPLYFVRSGWTRIDSGGLGGVANDGTYWSSSLHGSDHNGGYNIGINSKYVFVSINSRHYAFSLRCLSTVLDR